MNPVAVAPTLIIVGPVLVVMAVAEHRRRSRLRSETETAAAMPSIVDGLIQQLRAGRSLGQSCLRIRTPDGVGLGGERRVLAPIGPLIDGLAQRRTLADSARDLGTASDPSVRLLAVTLGVLAENGGPAVPALQRLRHTLIGVVNGRRQADAEAAQALASAGLLVVAPSLFGLLVACLDADLARFYLSEPLGAACVLGSVLLSWIGWRWMQRQLSKAGRLEL